MCPSSSFAKLHATLGADPARLARATAQGRAERDALTQWHDRINGMHATVDAIEAGASDSGDQYSDWGHYRALECGIEQRARLARDLLEFCQFDREPPREIVEVAARLDWTLPKRRGGGIDWERVRNVANRQSETQRLDDARIDRADVLAGSTGGTREAKNVTRRLNRAKLAAADSRNR